ncbi:hypothetical protein BDZ91DRAFT_723982 [Kalaharituber pfeilii]|nr:hypothetical protein BDZ91DRAFT_723982 [Kalaharituber pfeilii]
MDIFSVCEDASKLRYLTAQYLRKPELEHYCRSHLWINSDGETADYNPEIDDVPARRNWILQGWKYFLQSDIDKSMVAGYLDVLVKQESEIEPFLSQTEDIVEKKASYEEISLILQYLHTLIEFLIFELLMNSIRYDRHQLKYVDAHESFQQAGPGWGTVKQYIFSTCKVTMNRNGAISDDFQEVSLKLKNMICIINLYLCEARYKGKASKETRGRWGSELVRLTKRNPEVQQLLDLQHELPGWESEV